MSITFIVVDCDMSLESFVLIDSASKMDTEKTSEDTGTIDTTQGSPKPPPPPSASSFLQQHTHHDDLNNNEEIVQRTVSSGATEMVSHLIEGLVAPN